MREEMAILPMPRIANTVTRQTYGGADGFAVSVEAPDVAVDFVEHLTSIEVQTRLSQLTSKLPASSGADLALDAPLMAKEPMAGSLVSENQIKSIGAIEIELSNGIKVVLKPTNFKNDEIRMRSFSPGGTSLYSDEEYMSAMMSSQIIGSSGVGGFDNVQLDKYLSDKIAGAYPYISEMFEGMNGLKHIEVSLNTKWALNQRVIIDSSSFLF